jgi:cyclase
MRQITGNIYVGDDFRGCNSSFVVTAEGVVLIDTPTVPAEAKRWAGEIARHGQLRYVINGEPHNDHVAGSCWFGGTLVAHEGTRQAVLKARLTDLEGQLRRMAPDSLPLEAGFRFRPPEVTFSEELMLYLGGRTFRLIHLPGHTPYQACVYVPEEKVVFTSDNVIHGMPVLFQSLPFEWLESLKRLQQLDVEKVVPGHGNVGGREYLQMMRDNVEYCIGAVKAAIDRGWSLEEAQEKVTFADRFPLPPGDFMAPMRRLGIARLYEVLPK